MPTPAADMWVMTLTNSNEGGQINYAQFGIETNPAAVAPNPTQAAQIIAYVVAARSFFLAAGTLITRLQFRAAGTGGFVDQPFPDSEYNDLVANNAALATMHDYSDTVLGASGGLAPVGTSVCVSEKTAQFGPTGRGRHYLPFVVKSKVDGAGLFDAASITGVETAYNDYILEGNFTLGSVAIEPVVQNAAKTTIKPITLCKAQEVLSNLRSRRR